MTRRKTSSIKQLNLFKSKTIENIFWRADNVIEIVTTDGSSVEIWAETTHVGNGYNLPIICLDKLNVVKPNKKDPDAGRGGAVGGMWNTD